MNCQTFVVRMTLGLALALAPASPLSAQTPWSWSGALSAGQTIEIVGIEGDVRAVAARGAEARVVATKTARSGDPDAVRIVAVEHGGGVTICAVYPAPAGRPDNECGAGGGSRNVENVRVTVDFEVEVPAGVHFSGSTVSGEVRATGLTGDVNASSVSGRVVVSTAGSARASTVSGDIDVSMGRTDPQGMRFSTVSGDMTVRIAGDVDADVRFTTVSGTLDSDFPITLRTGGRRGLDGTIGGGGRPLHFSSVSGDVRIRRQ